MEDVDRKRLDGKKSSRTVNAKKMMAKPGAASSLGNCERRIAAPSSTSFDSEDGGGEVVLLADIPLGDDDASSSTTSSSSNNRNQNRRQQLGTYHVDFAGNVTRSEEQRGRRPKRPDPPILNDVGELGRSSTITSCDTAMQEAEGGLRNDSIEEQSSLPSKLTRKVAHEEPSSLNCCGMIFDDKYRLVAFVLFWILALATAGVLAGLAIGDVI
jgi:hypothetical protein